MITIRTMQAKEYPAFEAAAIALYSADSVAAGRINTSDSLKWAEQETRKILSKGIETPNHLFYVVEKDCTGPVGYIWCGRDPNKETQAFLFTILIFEQHRNRGIGHWALELLEQELHGKGFRSISLHVYSFNEAAVRLYRKLGYRETDLVMNKEI